MTNFSFSGSCTNEAQAGQVAFTEYNVAGTYTFTAPKSGTFKVVAVGSAGGGAGGTTNTRAGGGGGGGECRFGDVTLSAAHPKRSTTPNL